MLIVEPGYTWVTDLGRFAGPSMGLSVNGALDQYSATVANILVGNARSTPLLDAMTPAVTFVAETDLLFAVTGADCRVSVDELTVPMWLPVSARAGQVVHIGPSRRGLRKYIAVHGGITAPMLLGSCAPDSMLSFGTMLAEGDRLEGARPTPGLRHPWFELPLMCLAIDRPRFEDAPRIDVTDGPDRDEFGSTAGLLHASTYEVSPRSNHVGMRLSGTLPRRQTTGEVLSRGVPVGAIEVPSPEGLLVLHRGRGVTAGYPVLAVVTSVGLDAIAHVRPGQHLRFRRVSVDAARHTYLERHLRLRALEETCRDLLVVHGLDSFASASSTVPSRFAA